MQTSSDDTIAVVGGGLAGLATAAYLARAGHAVTVFERAAEPGGRAQTTAVGGYRMNLGPHALYGGGSGAGVLAELGIVPRGGTPSASGAYAFDRGVLHALPGGFLSLLTTGLFGVGAKVETASLLGGLARIDTDALAHTTVRAWVSGHIRHPAVRSLVEGLFRLATYANAPETMSAGLAVRQLQLALAHGVRYLDGGWQTLVDGLRVRAEEHGARLRTGAAVTGLVHAADGRVTGIRLRRDDVAPAAAVVLALDAGAAAALLPESAARRFAMGATPVRAACLDIALSRLPRPRATFALGIDEPLYFSVHSAVARLAPEGGALIHVARYLGAETPDPESVERQLERLLDSMQPGWRDVVVERRFLPHMVAASALATAAGGGVATRPGPQVPEAPGLFVAGDWVGPEGWLVDAGLASARAVARLVLARPGERGAAAA
jgi:phytoene dehydrogenase-like protein